MNGLFTQDGHASEQTLREFAAGMLEESDLLAVAEHVSDCETCAARLAQAVEDGHPENPPAGFEDEVRRRLPRRQPRAEIFLYSARVALAACAALILIFSSTLRTLAGQKNSSLHIGAPGFSAVEQISTRLNGFSQQLLHWEVFHHAEEKK